MAYTRSKFDDCTVSKEQERSSEMFNYYTDGIKYESSSKCRDELGTFGGPALSLSLDQIVSNQSVLLGLDKPLNKCILNPKQVAKCGTSGASELLCAPRNVPLNSVKSYGGLNNSLLGKCNIVNLPSPSNRNF